MSDKSNGRHVNENLSVDEEDAIERALCARQGTLRHSTAMYW